MKKNEALRDAVRVILQDNPSCTLAQIGERTGVTKARAQQIVDDMGYQYQPGKWKISRKRPTRETPSTVKE